MRGKQRFARFNLITPGITPADAGKTQFQSAERITHQDHPRGCGENENDGFILGKIIGSPPRMRGKHDTIVPAVRQYRITPADAGKTTSRTWWT